MQKITLPLAECLPGMLVAEVLRNQKSGVILITEGQELTEESIEGLQHLNFIDIPIYVNSWDTVWKIPDVTIKTYEGCKDKMAPLLEKIALGENINVNSFQEIKENILDDFRDNFKIVGCINFFQTADKYTYTHSINVALLSMLIGKWMHYGSQMIESLLLAGLLHDIGKMKISPAILNKPGKLTEIEFDEIKKHSTYSYDMIKDHKEISLDVKVGVLMHHEKIDGSGYPYGVYNENINDIAKVLAVADIYDAMISERPYKKKTSPFDVMKQMQEDAYGKLDTKILLTFLNNIANYYIGVYVLLNNGKVAEVVAINPTCVYRPIVKSDHKYIDLSVEKSLEIVDLT